MTFSEDGVGTPGAGELNWASAALTSFRVEPLEDLLGGLHEAIQFLGALGLTAWMQR